MSILPLARGSGPHWPGSWALSGKPSTSDLRSLVTFTGALSNSLEKQLFPLFPQVYINIFTHTLRSREARKKTILLASLGHND